MSRQMNMITGIFLIIIVVAGIWYWLNTAKPNQTDVDAATSYVSPVNANILSDNSMKNINNKSIYGDIPVKVEINYQNSDLFN